MQQLKIIIQIWTKYKSNNSLMLSKKEGNKIIMEFIDNRQGDNQIKHNYK